MFDFSPPCVTEIAPDVFRIGMYARKLDLQFSYFLVRDDEPLLFTTGLRSTFDTVREAVARLIDPATLRWIGFSHFESDECGALNHWLEAAPHAVPVCSFVGAVVNVSDFAIRPPRGMMDSEVLTTGRYRFQFRSTAQLPHGWDAGVFFEETQRTLLCSDLFHHNGDGPPLVETDLTDRVRGAIRRIQAGPLANYIPYTARTRQILHSLAELKPKTLAIMHGSSYQGDGAKALRDLADVMHQTLGEG